MGYVKHYSIDIKLKCVRKAYGWKKFWEELPPVYLYFLNWIDEIKEMLK